MGFFLGGAMGLGWLRFFLSLMVLDQHMGYFRGEILPQEIHLLGLGNLSPIGSGAVGVSGFFVLSGYLIAHVLQVRYCKDNNVALLRFYLSRGLRIFPPYWVVLGITLLLSIALGQDLGVFDSWQLLLKNLFLIPYAIGFSGFPWPPMGGLQISQTLILPQAWTISLDILFYLMAPFVLPKKKLRRMMLVFGAIIFLLFFWQLTTVPQWFITFYGYGGIYWFAFLLGAEARMLRWRPALWLVLIALLAVVLAAWLPLWLPPVLWQLASIVFLAILIARLGAKAEVPGIDRFLGELTYGVYLLQMPVLNLFERLHFTFPRFATIILTFLSAIALTITVERPIDRLRRNLDERLRVSVSHGQHFRLCYAGAVISTMLVIVSLVNYSYQNSGAWQVLRGRSDLLEQIDATPESARVYDSSLPIEFPQWNWRISSCGSEKSTSHNLCVPAGRARVALFTLPHLTLVGIDSVWVRAFSLHGTLYLKLPEDEKSWNLELRPRPPIWRVLSRRWGLGTTL